MCPFCLEMVPKSKLCVTRLSPLWFKLFVCVCACAYAYNTYTHTCTYMHTYVGIQTMESSHNMNTVHFCCCFWYYYYCCCCCYDYWFWVSKTRYCASLIHVFHFWAKHLALRILSNTEIKWQGLQRNLLCRNKVSKIFLKLFVIYLFI